MKEISIQQVSKKFGDVHALDQVNMVFEKNKIYGLLGRNGAGKSTLLNIITNRIFADKGKISVNGLNNIENDLAQQYIYLMSETNLYPDKMKVEEAFGWTKVFYPEFDMDYARKIAKEFGLNCHKKINTLSTGYQSIFKLVLALSSNVEYMLLDEPVLGLDANHRELFYKVLIEKYVARPCCIVISTHLIEEISNLLEHVVIIKEGKVLRNESCEQLLKTGYSISGTSKGIEEYIKGKEVLGIDTLGGLKTAYILGRVNEEFTHEGLEISPIDLQKLFIKLTNS